MSEMLITVGIPTWNRSQYLEKNLQAFIAQINQENVANQVELLISDNASTDNTQLLLESLTRQYAFVRYVRQDKNRGANANFQFVIEAAHGKYVWLFGDDDIVADDCISRLINEIEEFTPDVVVGGAVHDHSGDKATHHHFEQLIIKNRDILIENDVIDFAGKMSGLMFKRASVLPVIQQTEALIVAAKTPWPHLFWLIGLMNDKNKTLMVVPYGINQLVSAHWHNLLYDGVILVNVLFIDYQTMLKTLQSKLDEEFYQGLILHSVYFRRASLLKCVLYATYMNGFFNFLKAALKCFRNTVGLRNKMTCFFYLVVPACMPVWIRKCIFSMVQCKWKRIRLTIERLKKAKQIILDKKLSERSQFNVDQL